MKAPQDQSEASVCCFLTAGKGVGTVKVVSAGEKQRNED